MLIKPNFIEKRITFVWLLQQKLLVIFFAEKDIKLNKTHGSFVKQSMEGAHLGTFIPRLMTGAWTGVKGSS